MLSVESSTKYIYIYIYIYHGSALPKLKVLAYVLSFRRIRVLLQCPSLMFNAMRELLLGIIELIMYINIDVPNIKFN